jgi:hypothetical protein
MTDEEKELLDSLTPDDPSRFGSHLQIHKALYAFLANIGLDLSKATRVLDQDSAGRLCDRWNGPERDYWFLVPLPRVPKSL